MKNLYKKKEKHYIILAVILIFIVLIAPNGISVAEYDEESETGGFLSSTILCWWWNLNPVIKLNSPEENQIYSPGTVVDCSVYLRGFHRWRKLYVKYLWSDNDAQPDWKNEGTPWSKPWDTEIPSGFPDEDVYLHIFAIDILRFWTYKSYHFIVENPIENQIPVADFSADTNKFKAGEPVSFTFTGDYGDTPTEFQWNFGDSIENSTEENPIHIYNAPGIYNVTLTVIDTDNDMDTIQKENYIEVIPDLLPDASFMTENTSIIAGQAAEFTFQGTKGDVPAEFKWEFGDGTTNSTENPVHVYSSPGIYNVTLTVIDMDNDADTVQKENYIEVIPDLLPDASFMTENTSIIAGQVAEFTFLGTKGNSPTEFHWDFGDRLYSNEENPNHIYSSAGSYTVSLTLIDVDADSVTNHMIDYVQVENDFSPVANFVADKLSIIAGESISFTFTGNYGNTPSEFQWDFGDGTTSSAENPVHTYYNTGNFTVELLIEDANGDSSIAIRTDYIEVVADETPLAQFLVDKNVIVEGQSVQFSFQGSEGNAPATYNWSFGDGTTNSTEKNPIHTYITDGDYTVTLIVEDVDGDIDSTTKTNHIEVLIDLQPVADFLESESLIVAGQSISFAFTGELGNEPTIFNWNFGDGTTSSAENPVHTFETVGQFTVTLTVEDIDGDIHSISKTDIIEVLPDLQPVAKFLVDRHSILEGQSVSFTFTGDLGNEPTSFHWDFGDGSSSTEKDPVHTYINAGSFTVELFVEDANLDFNIAIRTNFIEVKEDLEPIASFSYSPEVISYGKKVQFTFTGEEGNPIATFLWDFDDGTADSSLENPDHVFQLPGDYDVTLTVTDSDGDTSYITVVITVIQRTNVMSPPLGGLIAGLFGGVIGIGGGSVVIVKKWKAKNKIRELNKIKPNE
jgi:PKD repeat protein